jgi:hypothetical protein
MAAHRFASNGQSGILSAATSVVDAKVFSHCWQIMVSRFFFSPHGQLVSS